MTKDEFPDDPDVFDYVRRNEAKWGRIREYRCASYFSTALRSHRDEILKTQNGRALLRLGRKVELVWGYATLGMVLVGVTAIVLCGLWIAVGLRVEYAVGALTCFAMLRYAILHSKCLTLDELFAHHLEATESTFPHVATLALLYELRLRRAFLFAVICVGVLVAVLVF